MRRDVEVISIAINSVQSQETALSSSNEPIDYDAFTKMCPSRNSIIFCYPEFEIFQVVCLVICCFLIQANSFCKSWCDFQIPYLHYSCFTYASYLIRDFNNPFI